MRKSMPMKLPQTVCFRLSDVYSKALLSHAERAGVSHGEYARQVLIDHLEDATRERLEAELRGLQAEIALLRGDFATACEALLVLAGSGKIQPLDAQTWVEDRLRQARSKGD